MALIPLASYKKITLHLLGLPCPEEYAASESSLLSSLADLPNATLGLGLRKRELGIEVMHSSLSRFASSCLLLRVQVQLTVIAVLFPSLLQYSIAYSAIDGSDVKMRPPVPPQRLDARDGPSR
jgi:hypothetical protein